MPGLAYLTETGVANPQTVERYRQAAAELGDIAVTSQVLYDQQTGKPLEGKVGYQVAGFFKDINGINDTLKPRALWLQAEEIASRISTPQTTAPARTEELV